MKNLYEKIKPYLFIALLGLGIWSFTGNILGSRIANDNRRSFERLNANFTSLEGDINGILSDVSDIAEGISGIKGTSEEFERIQLDLEKSIVRLEQSILAVGDESTESGILADRLYRISRELGKRYETNTE